MKQAIESYQQHQVLGLNSKTLEQQIFARLCYQLSHCLAGDDEFALLKVMADCRFFWVTLRARFVVFRRRLHRFIGLAVPSA